MLKYLYWLRWLLFPVGLLLAAWLLMQLIDPRQWQLEAFPWYWLGAAFAINLLYVMLYGLLWHRVTKLHRIAIPRGLAVAVYLFSNLGKFIPLKVVGIAFRIVLYSHRFGKDSGLVVRSCYVETMAALLAGMVVAVLLFPFMPELGTKVVWQWYLVAGVILLIMLLPKTQEKIFTLVFEVLKKPLLEPESIRGGYTRLVIQYAAAWLVLGTSLYVLCIGVGMEPSLNLYLMVTAIYVLAGMAGILVFVVPSGIGVREGVMLLGLSAIMPASEAALVTLLARVSITLAEMMGALLAFAYLESASVGGESIGIGQGSVKENSP